MGYDTRPGGERSLQIFDTVGLRDVDVLRVALIDCCTESHIPELYDIFGREAFLKFLDVFAGATIVCPSHETLSQCIRNVGIYLRVVREPDDTRPRLVRDLAVKYKITRSQVLRIFVEMEDRLKRYKIGDLKP